jgi:hypothetical protein
MSFGGESDTGYATARGRDWPSVRQFNIFIENRVGALMGVIRLFEPTDIRILSFTIIDSADCAIIRIVLNDPERALEILQRAKLPFHESDLLVVQLPEGPQPILQICKALLAAEVNIHYSYPLLVGGDGHPALALHVDDHEMATRTLGNKGLRLFTEGDFNP